MSDELVRVARRKRAERTGAEKRMTAFRKPRAADEGERLVRTVKAERHDLKRKKKAKRAFKKR